MARFNFNRRKSRENPIAGACAGLIFGVLFFGAAFPLLWWNEGRAVKRYKTLKEGEAIVVTIDPLEIDDVREGALVHATAIATTDEHLSDPDFGVDVVALRLTRNAQMYQWAETEHNETRKDANGNDYTETTYSYDQKWAPNHINSGTFHNKGGHDNPDSMPYHGRSVEATLVRLGNFQLSDNLVSKIKHSETLPLESATTLPEGFAPNAGWLYRGSAMSPAIGDLRVKFDAVQPQEVTVVAGQHGEQLGAYKTKLGTIELLQAGAHPAKTLFNREHRTNTIVTWAVRAGGWLAMFLGVLMLMSPITSLTQYIPGLRTIVNAGAGLVAFGLSASLASLTIALAWVSYRPMLAYILTGVALAIFGFLYFRGKRAES